MVYVGSGNAIGGLCLCFVDQIAFGARPVTAVWDHNGALKMFFPPTYFRSSPSSTCEGACLHRHRGPIYKPLSDIKRGHLGVWLRGFGVRSWSKALLWLAQVLKDVFTVDPRLLKTQWRLSFFVTHLSETITHLSDKDIPQAHTHTHAHVTYNPV